MYLANTVRPDIAFATSHLPQFSLDPTCHHMRAGISVLRYLLGTKELGLVWEKGKSTLTGYIDSDYAGNSTGDAPRLVMSFSVARLPFYGGANFRSLLPCQPLKQNSSPSAAVFKRPSGSPSLPSTATKCPHQSESSQMILALWQISKGYLYPLAPSTLACAFTASVRRWRLVL